MGFDKQKFITRFIEDAGDHISRLNKGLLALEKDPRDTDILNSIFRSAHTIKGSARMLKLLPVSETAHKLEDVLDAFRNEKITYSVSLADLLFQGIDAIEAMLDKLSAGEELTGKPDALCDLLEKAAQGKLPEPNPQSETPPPDEASSSESENQPPLESTGAFPETPPPKGEVDSPAPKNHPPQKKTDAFPEKPAKFSEPPEFTQEPSSGPPNSSGVPRPAETLRVRSDKLDALIKLMGEVVSGHSLSKQRYQKMQRMQHLMKRHMELLTAFEGQTVTHEILRSAAGLSQAVSRIASRSKEDLNAQWLQMSELQENALRMRMLPLSTIFDPFQRNIRQLARQARKEISFEVEGGETELDKKIIEKIGDSLLHMLRNSVDHGIEPADVRQQAGKPPVGCIRLSAGYEGDHVMIRIEDDGAGISADTLKAKVSETGLLPQDKMESMTESDIVNLIFQPGFSTKEIISDISGRGVGMDVVKKNIIEDLKGAIQVEARPGKGARFSIRLPLTMSIVHVLFIRSSGLTFAVPAGFIDEMVRAQESDLIRIIDKKAIRIREEIIPVAGLADILRLPPPAAEGNRDTVRKEKAEQLIVILSIGIEKVGVIVDSLVDEEEMVIKPLPAHMKQIRFVSGCIIADKNKIINVLHIPEIIGAAKEIQHFVPADIQKKETVSARHILVVDDSVTTREIEKRILESYGYLVTVAEDGAEGFEKAGEFVYDLVVTDVEMPNMDGFALTRKLRAEEAYMDTPIVLVTSLDKDEDKKKGMTAGADAYIVKGDFEQNTLIETVQHLIG